jgi:hypothetical protein
MKRIIFWALWAVVPVSAIAFHLGPGQRLQQRDDVAAHIAAAEAAASQENWQLAGEEYMKARGLLPDEEHAARMRQALVNENKDLVNANARYVMRITGSDKEGQDQLGNFIDPESRYPVLVTTSRLLSTGVDAQTCRLIVLDRAVGSMTEFKQNLIEHGMSMAESYLVEMLRARQAEFASGVIGSPFHALCDRLTGGAPGGVKVPQQALLHALKEAGWQDMGRIGAVGMPTKKHVFAAPDMLHLNKSEMRRMVEAPPPAPVSVRLVK